MKKVGISLILALVLAGGLTGTVPSQAEGSAPPPRPVAVATPWVGANTPWVFYQGDWFLNGVLYNYFGNRYGWAPYYAYAPTYIVRPTQWYAPRWNSWYKSHPVYWTNFQRQYPYWHGHKPGHVYDQNFYHKYHQGQGPGWQKGYQAGVHNPPPPAKGNHHPEAVGPGRGHQPPGQPGQYQPGQPAPGSRSGGGKCPTHANRGNNPVAG